MSGTEVLLVSSQSGQLLDFFDADTLAKLHTIPDLVAQPHELAWDARRRLVYIAHTYRAGAYNEGHPKAHEISVVDVDRRELVDIIDISPYAAPHDVEYDLNADLIYASIEMNEAGSGLLVIDAKSRQVVTHIPGEHPNAHWVAVSPDGRKAYLTHKDGPAVTVIDLIDRRVRKYIESPGGCEEVAMSPNGRFAYFASPMMSLHIDVANGRLAKAPPPDGYPTPRLLKIDTGTDEIVAELTFDEVLSALSVGPTGIIAVSQFCLPETGVTSHEPARGKAHLIDPDTFTLRGSVDLGEMPFTSRFSSDGRTLFVANVRSGTVSVVDVETCAVRATLSNNEGTAFGGTHGLCVVPRE